MPDLLGPCREVRPDQAPECRVSAGSRLCNLRWGLPAAERQGKWQDRETALTRVSAEKEPVCSAGTLNLS